MLVYQCSLLVWRRKAHFVVGSFLGFFCCFFFWWVRHKNCVWAECGYPLYWNSRSLSLNPSPRGIWQTSQWFPYSLWIQMYAFAQDRQEYLWGLTPTSILPMVEQASWFPFNQALSSVEPVTMPAQGEGASSFRLSSASVILVPTLTKAKLEKISHSSWSLSISYSARTGWKATHSFPLSHLWQILPRPGIWIRISPAAVVILCLLLKWTAATLHWAWPKAE